MVKNETFIAHIKKMRLKNKYLNSEIAYLKKELKRKSSEKEKVLSKLIASVEFSECTGCKRGITKQQPWCAWCMTENE